MITRDHVTLPPAPQPPSEERITFTGQDAAELRNLLGANVTIPEALRRFGEHDYADRFYALSRKVFDTRPTK